MLESKQPEHWSLDTLLGKVPLDWNNSEVYSSESNAALNLALAGVQEKTSFTLDNSPTLV